MNLGTKWFVFICVLCMAALACSLTPLVEAPQEEGPVLPTPTEPEAEAHVAVQTVLPHAVYFLSDMGGDGLQVWRLDADSITQTQITFEPGGVTGFDVSPVDGRVAYTTNNQIYVVDANGADRRLLADGGPVDNSSEDFHYHRKISGLSWSPDGQRLAYGQNGINLYQLGEGSSTNLIANQVEEGDPHPVGRVNARGLVCKA